ncbi:MAG: rhodanese-like domain-containing protein [Chlorobiaceae bacterium]|nr:rhodanese-like domain-containing protein [Chlorobiaceae bacterium]NTW10739.1 rhodanese-like domain-containing protein [Chlorobiaceae bacterium]
MRRFIELIGDTLSGVREIMPWDLVDRLKDNPAILILDVREPFEFNSMHIRGSINVPRGILESACEWDHEETLPELVEAKKREIVVVCRSGHRSLLSAWSLQVLGFENVVSLRTGLRGWNDYEEPMVNSRGEEVDADDADDFFTAKLRPEQRAPKK